MPERIVYKPGSPKPEGVVLVTGNTRWRNPHDVEEHGHEEAVRRHRDDLLAGRLGTRGGRPITVERLRRELRGRDLACSCQLDQACHADTLLLIANSEGELR